MAQFDLKKVGRLFDDTIAAIRDETPDLDVLEPAAIQWLKAARYKLMRDIEAQYYELARSRADPLQRPTWVDPSKPLILLTKDVPQIFSPFKQAFADNLKELLVSCGFLHATVSDVDWSTYLSLRVHFPAKIRAAGPGEGFAVPRMRRILHVEDEFSRPALIELGGGDGGLDTSGAATGKFAGSDFGRLLMDMRDESDGSRGAPTSGETSATGDENAAGRTTAVAKTDED